MAEIVITEKASQAKDVRAAVGGRYGEILPAEGHLFDLLEPQDVVPAWKHWSAILLRPEGLYGTRPADGGHKAAKLRAIREALRTAKRVWLATDCDREGQLIGQEILEHYSYRGEVMRVLFTDQDQKTIRDALRIGRLSLLSATQSRLTNGFIAEAINDLFQAARRKAHGYKRFSTIRTVIFLIAGKLDFRTLNPNVA